MNNQLIKRRRDLLPWWIKVFIWIFIFLGASSIISRIVGILGISVWLNSNGEKTIYGMETYENYSILALFITMLIIFKGITAFGMWTEKNWAIKFAIIDAVTGIAICTIMMLILPMFENNDGHFNINFRFELLLLIPYLVKCLKIRTSWEEFEIQKEQQSIPENKKSFSVIGKQENSPSTIIKETEQEKSNEDKLDKEDHSRFMPKQ